jgi:peptide deformylase
MNRRDIITLPHDSLRKHATKVTIFDDELAKIISDMESATLDWEDHRAHEIGVALAASQINKLKRLVVIRNNFDDKNDRTFLALVNPKILRFEGEKTIDYEGCLSVPDIYGKVPRYEKVKIKAQDLYGHEFRLSADGFLARVLQHEIDHTNGKLFVDYIKNQPDAFYKLDDNGKLQELDYGTIDQNRLFGE